MMGGIMLIAAACLVSFSAKKLNELFWDRWFRIPLLLLIVGSIMCVISLKSISPEATFLSLLIALAGSCWLIGGGVRLLWRRIKA